MKKVVFLIIGALLVLVLVLPGCTVTGYITIAVCGPMTELCGQNMWDGATMAMEEVNNGGGIKLGDTSWKIRLVAVETNECTEGEDGTTGIANLAAVINNVTFCVGGVRPKVVQVYRDVAMNASRIFMDCCAANASLQFSVVTNYAQYKYWFKASPLNEVFLFTSLFKMTGTIGGILQTVLKDNNNDVKPEYQIGADGSTPLRAAILADDATCCCCPGWYQGIVAAAQNELPLLGFNVTCTAIVDATAPDISSELSVIAASNPHIIFTAFCGSVGAVYSIQKAALGIPAMTIGINLPGQQLNHWVNTAGTCEGEIMLDTWAVNLSNTDKTAAWYDSYISLHGSYPGCCCVGAYDAVMTLCQAVQGAGAPISSLLVPWLENPANAQAGVAGTTAYYPIPAIVVSPSLYQLAASQVSTLYSHPWPYVGTDWQCTPTGAGGPHIAHDLVYGPGYHTGIGSQWQMCDGSGTKVGIWPKYLGPSYDVALTDQYGNWNFQYPGTAKLILPIGGMLNIPWDMCANAI